MQRVIDVSYHNGKVNWELVKAAGYHAILRAGYGTDRSDQDDEQFERNADACERLGIPWGAYLYSYADNTTRAMSEAAHMIRLMDPYKDARYRLYPCFFDAEQSGTEAAAATNAVLWCRQLEAEGYATGIYANEHWWSTILENVSAKCRWVAKWSSRAPSVAWDIWQCTDRADVPGCTGNGGRTDLSQSKLDISAPPIYEGPEGPGDMTADELADAVERGDYGNGEDRRRALGGRYDVVQLIVNLRNGSTAGIGKVADDVIADRYGKGEARKIALGSAYKPVQKLVNKKLK